MGLLQKFQKSGKTEINLPATLSPAAGMRIPIPPPPPLRDMRHFIPPPFKKNKRAACETPELLFKIG